MDEYVLDKVIKDDKAIVRVYRPILTEEERAKREEQVKRAMQSIGRAMQNAERKRGTA